MIIRCVLGSVLWIVSVGWLLPLAFSAHLLWTWLDTEVEPGIHGGTPQINSFPLLSESQFFSWIAFVWLALVTMAWVTFLSVRLVRPKTGS